MTSSNYKERAARTMSEVVLMFTAVRKAISWNLFDLHTAQRATRFVNWKVVAYLLKIDLFVLS